MLPILLDHELPGFGGGPANNAGPSKSSYPLNEASKALGAPISERSLLNLLPPRTNMLSPLCREESASGFLWSTYLTAAHIHVQARHVLSEDFSGKKKIPLLKAAILAMALAVVALLVLRGVNVLALCERGILAVRDAGPAVYFLAMALLPALGVPMLTFTLTAGPMFGERLGIGMVVVLSLVAITVNFILSYFLARRAMRPALEKLMKRLGYKLPKIEEGDVTDVTIIVRVTPGIPFFAQNYLLGLAGVPFAKYFLITCIFTWGLSAAFVLFGDALVRGQGKIALITASLVVAAAAATHLTRKHYAKKKGR